MWTQQQTFGQQTTVGAPRTAPLEKQPHKRYSSQGTRTHRQKPPGSPPFPELPGEPHLDSLASLVHPA
eukprot:CAMPEP_0206615002 /NCGR_PEP_ID=MMETSP0325_2-20121206/57806_1 /ASSEMBLY_ACC=CAM_ASM_000347 /TAXON_ID=2866 /ORGANISM="Crypthecodinium cohnii, Strain Seligo" /LENGTH=67 /DNA_ID=CAMNT_0054135763 /DNA_START=26 /DNA_END=225 /DNA_ORIENTATION=-